MEVLEPVVVVTVLVLVAVRVWRREGVVVLFELVFPELRFC